jgi:hypothetical protein
LYSTTFNLDGSNNCVTDNKREEAKGKHGDRKGGRKKKQQKG